MLIISSNFLKEMKNWISAKKPSSNSDHSLKSLMNYSFFNICHQAFSLDTNIKYKRYMDKITSKIVQQKMFGKSWSLVCQMIE